jgi:hypothetical protein
LSSQRRSRPSDRRNAWVQFDEREPAAHGRVDPRDRPVGGVHRPDEEQVLREGELLVGEYCRLMDSSRYSSRKYSSPKTLARFARLISSMIRM